MRFKSLTNDQTVPRYRYFNFYKPHKVDGKRIFLADAYFENCSVGSEIRLLAAPFWIVEREREIAEK